MREWPIFLHPQESASTEGLRLMAEPRREFLS